MINSKIDYFKNTVRLLFLTVFCFVLFSCKQKNTERHNETHFIKIYDSIVINEPSLVFQDYNKGNFLFFNRASLNIIVYNQKDNSLLSFNKLGSGASEYKTLYSGSLKFINDTIIGVGDISSIKEYSKKGNFLGKITFNNENTYATVKNFKIFNDSILFAQTPLQGNPSLKSFYQKKQKLFLIKNLNTSFEKKIIDFPIDGEDFHNKDYYYENMNNFPMYIKDNYYCFANSNGKNIHKLNMENHTIDSVIPLKLPNYNPLKIRFDEGFSNDKMMMNLFMNSNILSIYKSNKFTYVLYSSGYSFNEIKKFKNLHPKFPFQESPKTKFYLNAFNEEKTYEVKIPLDLGYPIHILNSDTVLIEKFPTENEDLKGITIIYKCKIQKK